MGWRPLTTGPGIVPLLSASGLGVAHAFLFTSAALPEKGVDEIAHSLG